MPRPCACNQFVRGKPKEFSACQTCWRYFHDKPFHQKHGGTGDWMGRSIVEPAAPTTAPRSAGDKAELRQQLTRLKAPCRLRGDIVKPKAGCGTQDVYACPLHTTCTNLPCSAHKDCGRCADYEART